MKESHSCSTLLYQLDMSIDHILIDEAQDLNRHQWELVNTIAVEFLNEINPKAPKRTLFVVGDYKQSIYGFQGAEPEYFKQVASYWRQKSREYGFNWCELYINCSFRSSKKVLKAVDNIFNQSDLSAFSVGKKHN